MHKSLITRILDALSSKAVTLLVLRNEVPAQEDNIYNQQAVATEMGSKGYEIARAVPVQEHLRSCGQMGTVSQGAPDCTQLSTYRLRFQQPR